jgi:hypothetical protein
MRGDIASMPPAIPLGDQHMEVLTHQLGSGIPKQLLQLSVYEDYPPLLTDEEHRILGRLEKPVVSRLNEPQLLSASVEKAQLVLRLFELLPKLFFCHILTHCFSP